MQNRRVLGPVLWGLAVCMLFVTLGGGYAQAAAPQRVAILPFTANAKDDISYLIKGVRDMLATRLAWHDKVTVIEPDLVAPVMKKVKPPYNDAKARKMGKELNAQAVVFGSITMFGKSVSVDARVVKTGDDSPALTTYVQASDMDQIIPQISNFAQRINAEIFRRPEAVQAMREQEARPAEAKPGAGGDQQQTAQDSNLNKLPPHMSPLNPLFLRSLSGVDSDRYWRSPRIKGQITSIAVADIDLDGKNEILALHHKGLKVYRLAGKHFALIYEMKNGPKGTYLFVDAADIDQDGRPEVFVSCLNDEVIESFVMVWQKGSLVVKSKNLPYYFRAQPRPDGKGDMLFGQKKVLGMAFSGPIYEMQAKGDGYVPKRDMKMPEEVHIFNFAVADLNGGGSYMTVLIGPAWDLQVWNRKGTQMWIGTESIGASSKSIVLPAGSTGGNNPGDEESYFYLPVRIVTTDLNKDGRTEVVCVKNSDRLGNIMEVLTMYYKGMVYAMQWNGMSLIEDWRTPRISGYLSDLAIADVGNVGRPALVMAVNQEKFSGLLSKGTSHLVAFTLKAQKKKAKKNKGL